VTKKSKRKKWRALNQRSIVRIPIIIARKVDEMDVMEYSKGLG